jgi:hypothetical protein
VDGSVVKTGTTVNQAAVNPVVSGSYGLVPVDLRGMGAGSHTVVVKHTGTSGQTLIVDSVGIWDANHDNIPYMIFSPSPWSEGYTIPDSGVSATKADIQVYRNALRGILNEHSDLGKIGMILPDSQDVIFWKAVAAVNGVGLLISDGMHPNKAGFALLNQIWVGNARRLFPFSSAPGGGGDSGGDPGTTVASFGPNGTHWPDKTPKPDDVATVVNVSCTWSAIQSAISAAGSGYTIIKVAPGSLPGNGNGSTATPVIQGVGSTGRASRILVTPRDGWGTVTVSNSARIHNISGVVFDRLDFGMNNGLVVTACQDFAISRSRAMNFNITGTSGFVTDTIQLVECVTPDSKLSDSDAWAFRTASGSAGNVTNVQVLGSYISNFRRSSGSTSHEDALQLSGNNVYSGITLTDTVIFSANNSAFQIGSAPDITIDHSLLIGIGDIVELRYGDISGADNDMSGAKAINGGGADGMVAKDSIILGSVGGPVWTNVTNTRIYPAPGSSPTAGAWTVDSTLASWTVSDLNAATPYPNDAYLESIW